MWDVVLKLLLKQTQLYNKIFISMLDFKTKLFLFLDYMHAHNCPIFSPPWCMPLRHSFLLLVSLAPSHACSMLFYFFFGALMHATCDTRPRGCLFSTIFFNLDRIKRNLTIYEYQINFFIKLFWQIGANSWDESNETN